MFVCFYCMNVCLVLFQPLGCQNPINVTFYVMLSYGYFSELAVLCWVVHVCVLHYVVLQ